MFRIFALRQQQVDASYRSGMCVRELMIFDSSYPETSYYVCPRCGITMEREFMQYCDRCGQCLDWRQYRRATVIHPKQNGAKTEVPAP